MVHLANDTRIAIRYLAERNGTPMGSPILRVRKTAGGWSTASDGWSTTSATLRTTLFLDPRTGKATEVFLLHALNAQPGDRLESLVVRELKPGQSVDFFILLEPGAAPERVGTICIVPQGKLARKLQPWLTRVKQWLRLKKTVPGQVEVWCPDSLDLASSPQPAQGN